MISTTEALAQLVEYQLSDWEIVGWSQTESYLEMVLATLLLGAQH